MEDYLARERELGIWTYRHFIRYLRALIFKLTPRPHRCIQRVFEALQDGSLDTAPVVGNKHILPTRLRTLWSNPPDAKGARQVARRASNAICEIIGYQHGYMGTADIRYAVGRPDDEQRCYQAARGVATDVEKAALAVGLTPNDLYECAAMASTDDAEVDLDRRDAAVAAIMAGHFKLAHQIMTNTQGED